MAAETRAPELEMLGKYRALHELGQGGTANVYLGTLSGPSGFSKLVVLKVLKRELATEREFRQMFLDEARIAARLNHPNVVQTSEVFEVGGRPVIVMEYLEGQPFSRLLSLAGEGANVPLNIHLKILSDVLSGLHYAHELTDYDGTAFRLVHRDMTPHNVFIAYDGRVSILDFGIAKLDCSSQETRTGVIKGKLRYMAPEQILGEGIDRRADVFSVGVMLWEAAAGTKMWKNLSDAAIMYNVVNNLVPSPRTARPDIPEELERVCMKALAFDANNRYASAAELQADVDALLHADPASTRVVAQFMGSLFREARTATKELIERKLSGSKSLNSAEEWDVPTSELTPGGFSPPSEDSSPPTMTATAPRERSRWVVVPLVLAGLAGAGLLFRWKRSHDGAGYQDPSSTVSTQVAPPSTLPAPKEEGPSARHVALNIKASPPTAHIYVDDQQLESNPYIGTVPLDAAPHRIRAVAPGYEAEARVVNFDNDLDVDLTLRRASSKSDPTPKAEPHQPSRPVAAAAPPRESRPTPSAPPVVSKVNCDPPFVMDAKGIRHFKPECL